MSTKRNLQAVFIFTLSLWMQGVCAEEVGKVQYTRGAVTMQNMDGSGARLIARNSTVSRGEVIKTGPKSFTIVKLNDGTRMTIRPNSSFSVEEFRAKKDSTASALLRLFKGGLRTITGYISKQNPDGYRVRTSVATIGIRGTEFDARICKDDCAEENNRHKQAQDKVLSRSVAQTVFVRGGLKAQSTDGVSRPMKAGSAVFEGDTLISKDNSYAIVVFRDKSRVSLQANTVFRVDEMKFDKDNAEESSALFSLLRGGLRTITGLIGKLHPKKYGMRTSVATIGIRGTGYDLMCSGSCDVTGGAFGDPGKPTGKLPKGDGLYASVWDGMIMFDDKVVPRGTGIFKSASDTKPVVLPTIPKFFEQNKVPKPDKIKVDEESLFSKAEAEDAPPGLYVSVTEGEVTVKNKSGQKLKLKAGQAGFADVLGRQATQLDAVPAFQVFDVYPTPDTPNPEVVNLNATTIGSDDGGLTCEIK